MNCEGDMVTTQEERDRRKRRTGQELDELEIKLKDRFSYSDYQDERFGSGKISDDEKSALREEYGIDKFNRLVGIINDKRSELMNPSAIKGSSVGRVSLNGNDFGKDVNIDENLDVNENDKFVSVKDEMMQQDNGRALVNGVNGNEDVALKYMEMEREARGVERGKGISRRAFVGGLVGAFVGGGVLGIAGWSLIERNYTSIFGPRESMFQFQIEEILATKEFDNLYRDVPSYEKFINILSQNSSFPDEVSSLINEEPYYSVVQAIKNVRLGNSIGNSLRISTNVELFDNEPSRRAVPGYSLDLVNFGPSGSGPNVYSVFLTISNPVIMERMVADKSLKYNLDVPLNGNFSTMARNAYTDLIDSFK